MFLNKKNIADQKEENIDVLQKSTKEKIKEEKKEKINEEIKKIEDLSHTGINRRAFDFLNEIRKKISKQRSFGMMMKKYVTLHNEITGAQSFSIQKNSSEEYHADIASASWTDYDYNHISGGHIVISSNTDCSRLTITLNNESRDFGADYLNDREIIIKVLRAFLSSLSDEEKEKIIVENIKFRIPVNDEQEINLKNLMLDN